MPLYLLERIACTVGYDETESVVVRAKDSKEARQLASTACGGEGKEGMALSHDISLSAPTSVWDERSHHPFVPQWVVR